MAEAISDAAIAAVLRPFVRAASPVLDGLRDADPFGFVQRLRAGQPDAVERTLKTRIRTFVTRMRLPGTAAWATMDPHQRTAWWVNRVGRFTTLIAAVPGLGGALADRLPVTDAVGAASQGLLLCAIAGEHGVTDTAARVQLLGAVLFRRELSAELAAGRGADRSAEDRETAELTADVSGSKVTLKSAATAVFKLGRALLSVGGELEKRPRGRWYHRFVGMFPVVGMLGDYLGERSALKRAARKAVRQIQDRKQQEAGVADTWTRS